MDLFRSTLVILGNILMFALIGSVFYFYPIILLFIALFSLGFNLAHGKAKWPDDYHPRSKGPVTWQKGVDPWYTYGKKLNPIWWTLNDDDPIYPIPEDGSPVKNDRHWPDKPQWQREILWWVRNPTCNFDRYILGFWDKKDWWTRERRWNRSGWTGKDTMWPLPGERWAICLPFISFQTKRNKKGQYLEFYTGWKPNSEFGWVCLRGKG